jgi:hypothetical protein
MSDSTHSGGCLCGAVRFQAVAPLRSFIACHCGQCRKQSGHYTAMTGVPLDRFALTLEDGLGWYRASEAAERGFCRKCGSLLFWKPTGEQRISISGGAFDGSTGARIEKHIFCADKGDYYEIVDDAQKLAQW